MSTNKSYLPTKDGPEAQKLIEIYRVSAREQRMELAKKFGYKNFGSFEDAMREQYGESVPTSMPISLESLNPEIKNVPYPDFKIKPFPVMKQSRDEEDIGIVLADIHFAKVTTSYSLKVAERRLDKMLDSTMRIINLHRPIRKAWIFDAGDNVQGESASQGSKIGETECGAYEQIHDYAVPILSKFCISLVQGVQEVHFLGVDGNHGIYDKLAPTKTNWDRFVYAELKNALINQLAIHVYPSEQFYQLVNIRGFRFFLIHGNQVNAQQGIPLFALRRKMQEWYAYIGGFNYAYCGHFHSKASDQVNSYADYTICPPLVTGDEWAVEKVGRASQPRQLCFGIHDRHGRTFQYKLDCDEGYLPRKFKEPEGIVKI